MEKAPVVGVSWIKRVPARGHRAQNEVAAEDQTPPLSLTGIVTRMGRSRVGGFSGLVAIEPDRRQPGQKIGAAANEDFLISFSMGITLANSIFLVGKLAFMDRVY